MADSYPDTPTPGPRQRKPVAATSSELSTEAASEPEKKTKRRAKRAADQDAYSPWVDILRVLSFLLVASCGLSYLVSGGETWFWYYGQAKPPYLTVAHWKAKFSGPRLMTLEELAAYDGTDPAKPIYLAINGSIYDVTKGSRIYGPGGSYHIFAGADASRGYVTGCFAEDRTADMRGVEDMYLPLEDYEVDKHWSREELNRMRQEERREAKKKVYDALKHWVDFFAKSPKYPYVGQVKREKGWLKKEPRRKLCEVAQNGRSPRKIPGKEG